MHSVRTDAAKMLNFACAASQLMRASQEAKSQPTPLKSARLNSSHAADRADKAKVTSANVLQQAQGDKE
eukprot:3586960-Amphidinium_carterae.1